MTTVELLKKVWANEDQMTSDLFQWAFNTFRALRGLLFHVPNGGARSKAEGAKFKAMGVLAGCPDFVCLYGGVPVGIELKMAEHKNTRRGGLSEVQTEVHQTWRASGMKVYVVYDAQGFIDVINEILGKKEKVFTLD